MAKSVGGEPHANYSCVCWGGGGELPLVEKIRSNTSQNFPSIICPFVVVKKESTPSIISFPFI